MKTNNALVVIMDDDQYYEDYTNYKSNIVDEYCGNCDNWFSFNNNYRCAVYCPYCGEIVIGKESYNE